MSLMQLLTASRSVNGAKDGPSRYKMAEQNLLPKFAPAKRPISLAPASVEENHLSPEVSAVETPSLFEQEPVVTARPVVAKSFEELKKMMPVEKVSPARKEKFLKTFFAKIFPARRTRKSSFTPVQAEWSLDKVAVMRNDLSETDLEVVPVRVDAKPPVSGARREVLVPRVSPKTEKLKEAWRRVADRVSKPEQNVFK